MIKIIIINVKKDKIDHVINLLVPSNVLSSEKDTEAYFSSKVSKLINSFQYLGNQIDEV
jgi:hypothetical protein